MHNSSASTVTFPFDEDDETEKTNYDNDDDGGKNNVMAASDGKSVGGKRNGSASAISAWNDSLYPTFDRAIDLCMRSNKDAVGMSTDSDPDQESLHLQLDDLDDTVEDVRSPVSRDMKSHSDSSILNKTSGDGRPNFHFLDKDGYIVGRKRENYQQKRSSSSDELLEKGRTSPVSIFLQL